MVLFVFVFIIFIVSMVMRMDVWEGWRDERSDVIFCGK